MMTNRPGHRSEVTTQSLVVIGFIVVAVFVYAAASLVPLVHAARQQPTTGAPAFDAASVKVSPGGGRMGDTIRPGQYAANDVPLRFMIRSAYGIQDYQLVGGPDWINSERFTVAAKAEGNPPVDQLFMMLRTLLEDRFKLVTHRETRELQVYDLVAANTDRRLGPQLRPTETKCAPPEPGSGRQGPPTPRCGLMLNFGVANGTGATMMQLARSLSPMVGRMIQDRTGLDGAFDFELKFTPDDIPAQLRGSPEVAGRDPNGPSLFTALREQLGLQLESSKAPVEVLVVDSAQRPTAD